MHILFLLPNWHDYGKCKPQGKMYRKIIASVHFILVLNEICQFIDKSAMAFGALLNNVNNYSNFLKFSNE